MSKSLYWRFFDLICIFVQWTQTQIFLNLLRPRNPPSNNKVQLTKSFSSSVTQSQLYTENAIKVEIVWFSNRVHHYVEMIYYFTRKWQTRSDLCFHFSFGRVKIYWRYRMKVLLCYASSSIRAIESRRSFEEKNLVRLRQLGRFAKQM